MAWLLRLHNPGQRPIYTYICILLRHVPLLCFLQVVSAIDNNETYLLYQCGTEIPQNELAALGTAKAFEIPLRAISAPDTTILDFMVRETAHPAYMPLEIPSPWVSRGCCCIPSHGSF